MKISVIIPVYNVEKYLPKCIDSILAQTFTNFELLLINDGSKDSSGTICDEYAAKDSRVKVFHIPNGGAGIARNYGIDKAKGEWICFIDSDDWVTETYIEDMVKPIADLDSTKNKVLVLQSGMVYVEGENKSYKKVDYNASYNKDQFSSFVERNNLFVSLDGSSCCKLLNRDVLKKNRIKFIEGQSAYEDVLFSAQYLSCVEKVFIVEKYNYFYRRQHLATHVSLSRRRHDFREYLIASNELEKCQHRLNLQNDRRISNTLYGIKLYALRSLILKGKLQTKEDWSLIEKTSFSTSETSMSNKLIILISRIKSLTLKRNISQLIKLIFKK